MSTRATVQRSIGSPGQAGRRRTAAQALIEYLSVQYSERDGRRTRLIPGIFGIFGHGNVVGLGQAVEEFGADLPHYQGKNEQSMVHAAIGYAKATRRMSTFACTASVGPGSTNMVTGAGTATSNRLPVLILPADVFVHRRQDPVLQQIEHPIYRDVSANDCFRPVSRYFDRLTNAEQLLTTLPEAMRVLVDPADTGAVTIALPQDVQGEVFDFPEAFFEPCVWSIPRRPAAEEELAAAVEAIRGAERPLIIAGGGVRYSEAERELAQLSEDFGIPVCETFAGKGCGPTSGLNLGGVGATGTVGANRTAAGADIVICVGTRLQDFTTGSHALFQNPNVRFVSINVGSADAHKVGALPVVGDAKLALSSLREALGATRYASGDPYRADVRDAQDASEAMLRADLGPHEGERMSQAQVVHLLNQKTGSDDVIVTASGGVVLEVHRLWNTANGTEIHIEFAFSCMGHEIPAGIGYRMARPSEPGDVFVLIGDGTYLLQPTELVTAVQERLKIVVVVLDNSGHQCIRSLQVAKTGTEFGTQLRERNADTGRLDGRVVEVDFVANAHSMGCEAWRAETLDEFADALEKARAADGPAVIVASIEPFRYLSENESFWDVGVAETSEREEIRELIEAHLEGRRGQRYYASAAREHRA